MLNKIKSIILSVPILVVVSCAQPVAAKGLPHIGEEKKFMGTKEEFCYDVSSTAKILHQMANADYDFNKAKETLSKDKLTNLYYKYDMVSLYDAYGGYKGFSEGYFQQRAYLKCMAVPLVRSTWDLSN